MNNEYDEPSLDKIDDYNGTETKEKRNIVRLVIIFCLVVGVIFTYLRNTSTHDDYIGNGQEVKEIHK